jgi:hypothetical protein
MKTFVQFITEAKVKTLYHSTPHSFAPHDLKPWSHLGSKKSATERASQHHNEAEDDGQAAEKTYHLHSYEHHPSGKHLKMNSDCFGQFHDDHHIIARELHDQGHITHKEHQSLFKGPKIKHDGFYGKGEFRHVDAGKVEATVNRLGFSHASYLNEYEGTGHRSTIVFNPGDLKHIGSSKIKVK